MEIARGPGGKVCPTLNLPLSNVLIESAHIDGALSMNAYIASFMLLLFNAVGLAVPASVAAESRMMSELGSAAELSQADIASQNAVVGSARTGMSDRQSDIVIGSGIAVPLSVTKTGDAKPVPVVIALRSETGDKLEHEEGAP